MKIKSNHTPGPWHRNIPPATKYNTVFAGRNTHVCHLTVTGLPPEQVEANCNLIAAAPEMLDLLLRLYEHRNLLAKTGERTLDEMFDEMEEVLRKALDRDIVMQED
jgi:hypothetical protein